MKKFIESLTHTIDRYFFPFYNKKDIKLLFKCLEVDETTNERSGNVCWWLCEKFSTIKKIEDIDIATIFTPNQLKRKIKKFTI